MKLTTRAATANVAQKILEAKSKIRATGFPENYRVVKESRELGAIARDISRHKYFAFDTETGGLNPYTDPCYCISINVGGISYLVNFEHSLLPQISRSDFVSVLGSYFRQGDVRRIGFNLAFDYHVVEQQLGIECGPMHFDSSIGIWLLKPELPSKKLKNICEAVLGIEGDTYESIFGRTAWVMIDPEVASYYAIKDADLHYRLYEWELQHLKKYESLHKLMFELEMPCANIFYESESLGIRCDEDYLVKELGPQLDVDIAAIELRLASMGMPEWVDLNAPESVSKYLFEHLKLPNFKNGSTGREVLEELQSEHDAVEHILEHRELSKLKQGFVDALPHRIHAGRIHPSVRVIGSETGRVSVANPNLLQMPAKVGPLIRRAFLSDPDYLLVSKDLSGQELRIQAAFSGDKRLNEIIQDGLDLYAESAHVFFNTPLDQLVKGNPQRDLGKKCVLAQNYGAQAKKIAGIFKCEIDKAKAYLSAWDRRFIGYTRWRDKVIATARRKCYVETILGRRRWLDFKRPGITKFEEFKLERQAVNTPIQGSAADQIKLAFLLSQQYFVEKGLKSRPFITIHDEILFRIYKPEWTPQLNADLDYIMTHAIEFDVEMKTSTEVFPERWGEAISLEESFAVAA